MKCILCTIGLLCLFGHLFSQDNRVEMSSSNYAIQQSAVVGAGGSAENHTFVLQHRFGSPNLGKMEGGAFSMGTAVEIRIEDANDIPDDFNLSQNYPNPFNQSTTFRYSLPKGSEINISIYSVLGQEIAVLLQGVQDAGRYTLSYAGYDGFNRPLPSGLYFCRMITKGFDKTIKFAILR